MDRRRFLKFSATAAATLAAPAGLGAVLSDATGAHHRAVRARRPDRHPARFIAQRLTENLGRNFLVENVAGASSNIGTAQAAKAAPDGYTILITVNNLVINPSLFEKVAFDPYKDFDPVVLAVAFSSAFAVHPSVPAKTVKELIEVIRANPGKYSYASPGLGTPSHLLGEQFRVTHNLDIVHVPYGGSGPAITATISGHTPICFASITAAAPQAQRRQAARAGGAQQENVVVDAGSPDHRRRRLPRHGRRRLGRRAGAGGNAEGDRRAAQQADQRSIALPELKEKLRRVGLDPIGGSPEDFASIMRTEGERWAKVIKAANVKAK